MEGLKTVRLAALVIFLITSLGITLAYVPGTQYATMYSIDDRGPFGLSTTYEILSQYVPTKTVIGSLSTLLRENYSKPVLFIVGPYRSFSSDEISGILFLIARGASIIIASDFGSGNQILVVLSYILYTYQMASSENRTLIIKKLAFNGSVLMDAASYINTPAEPLVRHIVHDSDPLGFFNGVDSLATYMPTTLTAYVWDNSTGEPREYRTPLPGQAMTTQFSRLETNLQSVKDGTYKPDPDERGGVPFSVATYFFLGGDQFVMLVSDPDVFSNRFVASEAYGNAQFVRNIGRVLQRMNATLIIDQSHQPAAPITSTAYLSILLHTIAYFTLYPILGILVPWSIYSYLRKIFPEYEARGILLKRAKRRTAYEFNPDALKALEKNDFTEPLKLLLEKFKADVAARYGSWSERLLERLMDRKKVPKNLRKALKEAFEAAKRGGVPRDEFVLYARSINEVSKLLEVRRYER